MIEFGRHWEFVFGSYAVVTIGILGMIAYIAWDAYKTKQKLEKLEANNPRKRNRA